MFFGDDKTFAFENRVSDFPFNRHDSIFILFLFFSHPKPPLGAPNSRHRTSTYVFSDFFFRFHVPSYRVRRSKTSSALAIVASLRIIPSHGDHIAVPLAPCPPVRFTCLHFTLLPRRRRPLQNGRDDFYECVYVYVCVCG